MSGAGRAIARRLAPVNDDTFEEGWLWAHAAHPETMSFRSDVRATTRYVVGTV